MAKISDEEIRQLWEGDPKTFFGAYAGIKTFQAALFAEKNIKLSERRIRDALFKIPNYIAQIQAVKRFPRRSYNVQGLNLLWQADLAEMFAFNGFKFILVVVDVFSRRIFARPMKSKEAKTVKKAFEAIFEENGTTPQKLETDRGTEFTNSTISNYFEEKNIYLKFKYGMHKGMYVRIYSSYSKVSFFFSILANFAEHAIYILKKRLYTALRVNLSRNWPSFLDDVVVNLNKTPREELKYQRPIDFKSELDDPKLNTKNLAKEPSMKQQDSNQLSYENDPKRNPIQKNSYVYVVLKKDNFSKSHDIQVSLPIYIYKPSL